MRKQLGGGMRTGRVGGATSFALAMLLALLGPVPLQAQATFVVNTPLDIADPTPGVCGDCDLGGGQCSLRAAVSKANACSGADTIRFAAALDGTPIVLSLPCDPFFGCGFDSTGADGDLDVAEELTIAGNGATNTIIQGGTSLAAAADRVIQASAPLTIAGVTIRYGNPREDGAGGGISAWPSLTLTDSVVTDNRAIADANGNGRGGGIFASQALILSRVTIRNNVSVRGGGVFWDSYDGALTITESTFDHNSAIPTPSFPGLGGNPGLGGALNSALWGPNPGVFGIVNSTFSRNTATEACAIYHQNGILRLHGVTVANNCAPGSPAASVVATYGDGFTGGEVRLENSVLSSGAGTDNCRLETIHGTSLGFSSAGYNLATDATCGLFQAGDVQGVKRADPDSLFNRLALALDQSGICKALAQVGHPDAVRTCQDTAAYALATPVEPTHAFARSHMAGIWSELGDAFGNLAARARLPPAERRAHRMAGLAMHRRSLEIWSDLTARKLVAPVDASRLAAAAAAVKRTEAGLGSVAP